ncbi:glycosyltransferase [Thalassotalea euphylliae]|uniref:Glycosyltransferase n=1 Tax=Thalassotalea euphylliae TaxID=1655234 RepID=A0A3E0ULF2_9GAMM|nr:glycosyltransferase [Thalassotalea euphylliae]REL36562.1 glycosyltransferase [Thalassotalea euphylliae]
MKVLISAYACEPNRGSEAEVGWRWALENINAEHDVWVLTRRNNKPVIEDFLKSSCQANNINFIYYDLPVLILKFKQVGNLVHLYYLLWQWGAYKVAKLYHAEHKFDLVHHVTFVSVRQPSFMGGLGIPFIFGPVGGGESSPKALRKWYSAKGKWRDALRDAMNAFIKFDPFMHSTFKHADRIFTTSSQTKNLIPKRYHYKTDVRLAITTEQLDKPVKAKVLRRTKFKLLFVGRFVYLKGLPILFRALQKLNVMGERVELTLIGKGEDQKVLCELAKSLNIEKQIIWINWLPHEKLIEEYQHYDAFAFPSLRDSGGLVLLEAMKNALPVLCFDLGGPNTIIDNTSGIKISSRNLSSDQAVDAWVDAIKKISRDNALYHKLSYGALLRVSAFTSESLRRDVYQRLGL